MQKAVGCEKASDWREIIKTFPLDFSNVTSWYCDWYADPFVKDTLAEESAFWLSVLIRKSYTVHFWFVWWVFQSLRINALDPFVATACLEAPPGQVRPVGLCPASMDPINPVWTG